MENNTNRFPPIPGKLNIILAEDDFADRLFFEDALEELPVTVNLTTVSNGEQLIEWLAQKDVKLPDVLFLDLKMPRKNGFAALGQIKRSHNLQDLPVVIFSTIYKEKMIKQVFKDAAHYYIRKPNDFQELKKLIYKALKLITENGLSLPNREDFILSIE